MRPDVSVLIASYNRPELLRKTVMSILGQSLSPAEIVIVDDGSPLDVQSAVSDLGPKVHFHRQANAGICNVRNNAVRLSKSPWIAFCDNDDLWHPDKLERQMNLHVAFPDVRYSFTNFAIVSENVWSEETKFDALPADFFGASMQDADGGLRLSEPLYDKLLFSQPIFPSTVVMARDLYVAIGGSHEPFGHNSSEDLELTLRCAQIAPVGVILEPVVGIRKHPDNKSRDTTRVVLDQIVVLRHALQHHVVSPASRALIEQAIAQRSVDASFRAFTERRFDLHQQLLSNVPAADMTARLRLKQAAASLPRPLALLLASILELPFKSRDVDEKLFS